MQTLCPLPLRPQPPTHRPLSVPPAASSVSSRGPSPTHPPTHAVQQLIPTACSSSIHPPTHPPLPYRNWRVYCGTLQASQDKLGGGGGSTVSALFVPVDRRLPKVPIQPTHPPTHPPTHALQHLIQTALFSSTILSPTHPPIYSFIHLFCVCIGPPPNPPKRSLTRQAHSRVSGRLARQFPLPTRALCQDIGSSGRQRSGDRGVVARV